MKLDKPVHRALFRFLAYRRVVHLHHFYFLLLNVYSGWCLGQKIEEVPSSTHIEQREDGVSDDDEYGSEEERHTKENVDEGEHLTRIMRFSKTA